MKSVQFFLLGGMFIIGLASLFSCGKYIAPLFISDDEEIAMGANFDTDIRSGAKFVVSNNVVITRYIDSIGQIIADEQTQRRYEGGDFPFHFAVIEDSTINAFAVPGGYVYVNTGLIKNASTEEEIAGVIAHEVAHVTNAHGRELMVKQYGVDVVEKIVGFDSSQVADALAGLIFLKYSRENENEADSCGVEFMHLTSWNPKGMADFFQVLIDKSSTSLIPEWLSTHPDTDTRKKNVERIMGKHGGDIGRSSFPIPTYVETTLAALRYR